MPVHIIDCISPTSLTTYLFARSDVPRHIYFTTVSLKVQSSGLSSYSPSL